MINYRVQNKNEILETQTDQVIEKVTDISKIKKRIKHYNHGGGFDGFTPAFVLIKLPNK